MTIFAPRPGLVIRYSYLWSDEAVLGNEEGVKDRPCAVLLAIEARDRATQVIVLPITHRAPLDPTHAVELPANVKSRLGLDDERSWIVLTELNQFVWPGPDLRPLPGGDMASASYGELPAKLYLRVREQWLNLYERGRIRQITRTD